VSCTEDRKGIDKAALRWIEHNAGEATDIRRRHNRRGKAVDGDIRGTLNVGWLEDVEKKQNHVYFLRIKFKLPPSPSTAFYVVELDIPRWTKFFDPSRARRTGWLMAIYTFIFKQLLTTCI